MAGFTERLFERDSLNGTLINNLSVNGTLTNTGLTDMSRFNKYMCIVSVAGAGGAVAAYLQQGNNANGSDQANIANAAAATMNSANSVCTLEISSNQLTGRYVRTQLNTSAAVIVSAVPIGTDARYAPANAYDSADVVQRFAASP